MPDTEPATGIRLGDIGAAFSLLSRLPVNGRVDQTRLSASAWAFPLVGAVHGGLAGFAGSILLWLGASAGIAALVALLILILLSGALHEDGLADCADGFWGGHDRARILDIMKDSRIGAYGTLALILFCLGRWHGMSEIPLFPTLILVGAVSRVPMCAAMTWMPNARGGGLSATVGAPRPGHACLAAAIALALGLLLNPASIGAILLSVLVAWSAAALFFVLAHKKIGGQTGDVLGGSQQISELVCLITLAMLI